MSVFRSNGKLLLTGEYAVLDGALALALPTVYGQSLDIKKADHPGIHWKSIANDGTTWFEDTLDINALIRSYQNDDAITKRIFELLICAKQLNPHFLEDKPALAVTTILEFERDWGLGSSSTLVNNIAQWAQVDAFELLHKTFGGSGYDVACAQNDRPILYQLEQGAPQITPVDFYPDFRDNLFFVHLNQKQKSDVEVMRYAEIDIKTRQAIIPEITALTQAIVASRALDSFEQLILQHETLLSGVLQRQTVKDLLFPDFNGTVKSLGAWGGDFVLALSKEDPRSYFSAKGYHTLFAYDDLIKKVPQ